MLKDKNEQQKILCLETLNFKSEGKIKTFSNKQKLRQVIITRPILTELFKGALQKKNEMIPDSNSKVYGKLKILLKVNA